MSFDSHAFWNLVIAALSGLAIGVEREWSGHAKGPRAHFAGVRTFTLLGLVAGLSGWLWTAGIEGLSLVLLAGLGALVVAAYLAASRRDVEGTTEVAAFVVLAAGALAGAGYLRLASGITAITLLLLVEKKQLHGFVSKLDRVEIRAGARFAVMAAVILPLLPTGPYPPYQSVRPRLLWAVVLLFSGLSFVAYVLRRVFGRDRGYAIAGTVGGAISSTSVTIALARLSRGDSKIGRALAAGALGANTVLFLRVLIASAVLAPALAFRLWPSLVLPFLIGMVLVLRGFKDSGGGGRLDEDKNPLHFSAAIQMALLFQVVLVGVGYANARFGAQGIYASAAIVGTADMDALTISMAQQTAAGLSVELATKAITIGLLASTLLKLAISLVVGRGQFRLLAATGLVLIGAALAAAVVWP